MPDRRTAAVLAALMVAASLLAHASSVAAQQGGEALEGAGTYPDTPTGTYYAEPVAQLAEQGVFTGTLCESGFCPDDAIDRKTMAVCVVRMLDGQEPHTTRAQMATFLWRAESLDLNRDLPSPDDSDCSFSKSAPDVAASVFQVITERGTGTAFYVGDDQFVTAAHVVAGVGTGQLRLRNAAKDLTAQIVGADFETDIAVLSAPGAGIAPLLFGSVRGLDLGHPLGVVGYPVYEAPSASLVTGVLSRTEDDDTLGTLLQTDAAINPGNSGGPVIDECGRVLGMAVPKLVGQGNRGHRLRHLGRHARRASPRRPRSWHR